MRVISILMLLMLAGCQPKLDDLEAFVAEVEQQTQV